jgi:hypothetical protein
MTDRWRIADAKMAEDGAAEIGGQTIAPSTAVRGIMYNAA